MKPCNKFKVHLGFGLGFFVFVCFVGFGGRGVCLCMGWLFGLVVLVGLFGVFLLVWGDFFFLIIVYLS